MDLSLFLILSVGFYLSREGRGWNLEKKARFLFFSSHFDGPRGLQHRTITVNMGSFTRAWTVDHLNFVHVGPGIGRAAEREYRALELSPWNPLAWGPGINGGPNGCNNNGSLMVH